MRYFKTTNASRQYRAGDLAVTFEPADNVGGSWSGLLAVEDNSIASKIVAAGHPQITEITPEQYDGLKKKPRTLNHSYRDSARLPPSSLHQGAERAAPAPSTSSNKPAATQLSASLKSAKLEVPDELKLETGEKRPR